GSGDEPISLSRLSGISNLPASACCDYVFNALTALGDIPEVRLGALQRLLVEPNADRVVVVSSGGLGPKWFIGKPGIDNTLATELSSFTLGYWEGCQVFVLDESDNIISRLPIRIIDFDAMSDSVVVFRK
ncbi:MAG TPA: hypothetical protein VK824_00120, partial [Planctomycetota bacterium]|nr:hypothetical protein [Planctomycetota bacterium]